jgi:hypothetical protein
MLTFDPLGTSYTGSHDAGAIRPPESSDTGIEEVGSSRTLVSSITQVLTRSSPLNSKCTALAEQLRALKAKPT